ncbi:ABC transporter transmembrane domain-containing protein [Georgenia faecalis]|uniref:ABC transporter transmembrane domain-containing protein n=1 Tax=Georgenia faecalis TaxID=2483799 RepID=A0ABV9D8I6_9MICO|nr:ABC transporter ATP-binding protein [Georgenia faecalis]
MLDVPTGHPGHPPLTTPLALLGWVTRRGTLVLLAAVALATIQSLCAAAVPYLLGRALDAGLGDGLTRPLLVVVGLLLVVGLIEALSSALSHAGEVGAWMHGTFTSSRLVGHHVTRTGSAIGADLPTGEVVSTVATDSFHVGNALEMLPRFVGGLVTYVVVAVVLLRQSLELGLVVLIGLPVVAACLALIVRPLHARQQAHREASGRLATLGTDTVAGLRILRGIGGEDAFAVRYRDQSQRVRHAGVGVAGTSALLEALQVLLPGLVVVAVVWYGALLAMRGEITPGELVTFYGYTAFLAQPLRWATQFLTYFTRARVAARKIITVLSVEPGAGSIAESEAADARPARSGRARTAAELVDEATGVHIRPGTLTALVAEHPEAAAALAVRLGRFDDAAETPVHLDGVPLRELPVAEVRERVVVAGASPQLFTGTLREGLDARGTAVVDDDLLRALDVADAHDVLDSMPERLDGEITEKGRSLSGGQRQRVALARALLTDAEALVLVEPTSAVDAHTESRIAARLAHERRGRTTVVVTSSPLVLEHADEVVLLADGRERTRGTHRDLLARAAAGDADARAYHDVVGRAHADDDGAPVPAHHAATKDH